MIEAAEARGADRAGPHDDRRGHERQHRHRARVRVRRQGLRPDPHAPAGDEPRARGAAAALRRAGAHHRVDGRHERGGRRRAGAGPRPDDFWLPDQFSNPANPEAHRRTTGPEIWEALDGKRRLPRRRRRHRRHDHRRRRVPEGAQPGRCQVVAVEPAASPVLSGGRARAAQDPGHRRGLRPAGARPRRCSTRSSPSTTRTRSRPRALAARREGVLCRHLVRRRAVRRARRSPRAPEAAGKRIAVVLPDSRRALRLDAVLRPRAGRAGAA